MTTSPMAATSYSLANTFQVTTGFSASNLFQSITGSPIGLALLAVQSSGNSAAVGTYTSDGSLYGLKGVVQSTGFAQDISQSPSRVSSGNLGVGPLPICLTARGQADNWVDAGALSMTFDFDVAKFSCITFDYVYATEESSSGPYDTAGIIVNGINVALDGNGQPLTSSNSYATGGSATKGTSTGIIFNTVTQRVPVTVPVSSNSLLIQIVTCDGGISQLDTALLVSNLRAACPIAAPSSSTIVSSSTAAPTSSSTSITPTPLAPVNARCNRDNCLRGLMLNGNAASVSANYAACSTALPTVTVSRGQTTTRTITGPAMLPTNANICDGQGYDKRQARYISACSCISVYPQTVTITE